MWIGRRSFDLVFFFGGAALAVFALAVAAFFRSSIVFLAWAWILLFDGPHMMALYTRTYLDPKARRERRGLLFGSLAVFAVGPVFLALSIATRSDAVFLGFVGFASLYGYYHVVRQHYGFVALYRAKTKEAITPASYAIDKGALYLGMWLPWGAFLVAHPIGRGIRGSSGEPSAIESMSGHALFVAWIAVVVGYAIRAARLRGGGLKAPYLLLVIGVHGLLYFVAARFEPVYSLARNTDQQLLLMTVMGGLLHSAQYIGIVWLYNEKHNAARFPTLGRYLFACVAFSALYFVIAALTAVYPAFTWLEDAKIAGVVPVSRLALCVFWGIALHHYVVDQYIWRIKRDPSVAALATLVPRPSSLGPAEETRI
jgi:hypothetical protein